MATPLAHEALLRAFPWPEPFKRRLADFSVTNIIASTGQIDTLRNISDIDSEPMDEDLGTLCADLRAVFAGNGGSGVPDPNELVVPAGHVNLAPINGAPAVRILLKREHRAPYAAALVEMGAIGYGAYATLTDWFGCGARILVVAPWRLDPWPLLVALIGDRNAAYSLRAEWPAAAPDMQAADRIDPGVSMSPSSTVSARALMRLIVRRIPARYSLRTSNPFAAVDLRPGQVDLPLLDSKMSFVAVTSALDPEKAMDSLLAHLGSDNEIGGLDPRKLVGSIDLVVMVEPATTETSPTALELGLPVFTSVKGVEYDETGAYTGLRTLHRRNLNHPGQMTDFQAFTPTYRLRTQR